MQEQQQKQKMEGGDAARLLSFVADELIHP